ncbi:MAG: hypothetical protein EA426_17960 [Spirochaetaceae bacterium]|nr:MAG: hypothetical protein EA426_17960 [Spirochaetaceae bacterium]
MREIILREIEDEVPVEAFTPPFCPNPRCREHTRDLKSGPSDERWFYRHGRYGTDAFGAVPRFRCRRCGRGFGRQTFRVDYYAKRVIDYRELFQLLVACSSTRDICRTVGCSTGTTANRIERLARQAVAMHGDALMKVCIDEPVVVDGFENFAVSKFFPNNVNILTGAETQFLYDFDYRTIRRSGQMTAIQKLIRKKLERLYRADRQALVKGFTALLDSLMSIPRRSYSIRLRTDCKTEYRRAIESNRHYRLLEKARVIVHERTPSTEPRTRHNKLFAVNYLDRQFRKDLKECVRRTVCFGRNICNVMQRMVVYRMYHNHFKAFRHRNPGPTHGSMAALDERWVSLRLSRLFGWREFPSRTILNPSDRAVWMRELVTPLKSGAEYLPKFAWY